MSRRRYDVFICHNSRDKPQVRPIAEQLRDAGIKVWFDEWNLRPGTAWQSTLERQIERIRSAAVFVGDNGIGPWQDQEVAAFLREFVSRPCPVIPVILAGATEIPDLPLFLRALTWVNFNNAKPDPFRRLVWGITGKEPVTS